MTEFDRAFAAFLASPACVAATRFVPRVRYFRSVLAQDLAGYIADGWRACAVDVKPSVADFIVLLEREEP